MEKIIHQIWVGPYEMPDMEKFFVDLMKKNNPDYVHYFWTNNNLPKLPEQIQNHIDHFIAEENYAFAADVLRIFLVREYGGIYLDVDWHCHKGFQDLELEKYSGFIPYHGDYKVGNELFGCSSKTGFIEYMYNDMISSHVGSQFMPYWFTDAFKKYLKIVNTWESDKFTTEEYNQNAQEFIQLMKDDNLLCVPRWLEFEHIYMSHRALYSWEDKHKKMFKEGNINYKEEYCFISGYNSKLKINSPDEIGDAVKLIKVTYGNTDVTDVVQKYCIKNNEINIPVTNDMFTDTLPNTYKQMVIEFNYNGHLVKDVVNEGAFYKFPKS